MAEQKLAGKRVAILAADMFERVELEEPKQALEDAGATTEIVSIHDGEIQGFDHFTPSKKVKVAKTVEEVSAADYDALSSPAVSATPTSCAVTRTRSSSFANSSKRRSPSGRSAMRRGSSSRPASCAGSH